ncbi:MAG: serine hydrolase domain-containing protein [Candidatus Thorarchaeota archaeon]|jgi:CubicO group peptidase (beta-lactamase class C family)
MINTDEIDSYIKKLELEDRFSGAVLIAKDGEPVFQQAYGLASKTFNAANTVETKFNLGSLNKIFTKVAILQLMQEGKLGLDDIVGTFLPEYPSDVLKGVTIRQLITHSSGLGHYWTEKFQAANGNLRTVDDFVELFQDEPLLFKPGEKREYSNNGYVVLGKVIEAITGQSYYDYMRERVYGPAEMHSTDHFERDSVEPDLAVGYTTQDFDSCCPEGERQQRRNNIFIIGSRGSPAGGGYSTLHDILRFDLAVKNNVLLNAEYSAKVFRPINSTGDSELPRVILLAGGAAGVSSFYMKSPQAGYTVIVLSNYDPTDAAQVEERIRKTILDA